MRTTRARRLGGVLCACVCGCLTAGCPAKPRELAHDLAPKVRLAESWSRRELVLFGTPGAEPYEADGFYREAPGALGSTGFLWSKREAELAFHWPELLDRTAIVELAPYAGVPGQSVAVQLNGTPVGGFTLNDARHRYALALPKAAQRPGDNRVRFVFSAAASPADKDPKNGDDRQLAAAFHTVTVGPSDAQDLDDLLRRDAPSPFGIHEQGQVPYLTVVGDAGVRFALRLPAGAELRFIPELDPGAQAAAASALFKVTFENQGGQERELWSRVITPADRRPAEVVVPLPGQPNAIVRLGLHVLGQGNGRFAWGVWRAPRILGHSTPGGIMPSSLPAAEQARAESLRSKLLGTNVILIVLDAARAQQFSCYGYGRATTPQIDRLASEGVLFEQAFTPAVYTLAAMSSVWTSQYPDRHHGELAFSAPLPAGSFTLAGLLSARAVPNVAFVANAMAGKSFGLLQGFEEQRELFREGSSNADIFRPHVTGWLEEHRDQRFFAYLHFREPHFPYDPKQPFDTRFGPEGPIVKALRRDSRYFTDVNEHRRPFPSEEREHLVRLYDGNLAFADAEIGFLRRELERLSLLEKTVVMVIGDHGEALWEHGFVGHNTQLYDESLRVPMIVRLPGAAALPGQRVKALVDLLDVAPTIADVFGLLGQGEAARHFQGRSLLAVLQGAPGKGAILSRTVWDRPRFALRDERHKFVYDTRTGEQELYDLQQDPHERTNVAGREGVLTAYYRQALHAWIAAVAERGAGEARAPGPAPDRDTCLNLKSLGYLPADDKCPEN